MTYLLHKNHKFVVFCLFGDSLASEVFIHRRFGTICSIFIGRLNKTLFKRPMKMEEANRFETSAY